MSHRCRLYLITPPVIEDVAAFSETLKSALNGGDVACLQIRLKDKSGTPASVEHVKFVARAVLPIAQAKDVAVLINDRPDLAAELGADGVHIGQDDTPYAEARRIVGEDAIIGVTCHDSRHLALEAGERGADYVAFGAFFPTETKDPKARADKEILTWWQAMVELPCVAIGGVTVDNAKEIIEAGADFIAVSGGVWNHPDGAAVAVKSFNAVLDACAANN